MIRPFAVVLLTCWLLLGLMAPADAQVRHRRTRHRAPAKSAGQLKSKLRQMRHQRAAIHQQLRQAKHQANVVVSDIHVVDARLERIEDELDRTSKRLGESQSEQQLLAARLRIATKRMLEVKAQLAHRIADKYMQRGSSFLSALAGTRSVKDLLTRQQILEAIAKYDHDLFLEYRNLRSEIATKKRRQDLLVENIRDLKVHQVRQQGALKETRVEKGEVLQSLQQKQEELKRLLAQYDADMNSISSEIAEFERMNRHRTGSSRLPATFIGRFLKPARGPITSGFGMRYHPILRYTRPHNGIDFGAPFGSTIVAAADGEVIAARYSSSFGNVIIIAHGGDVSTVYAHCSRLFVSRGQRVRRGQPIGAVGATGLAKGPHLHWEVHVGGRAVNPLGRF